MAVPRTRQDWESDEKVTASKTDRVGKDGEIQYGRFIDPGRKVSGQYMYD
jgi:hypothetical protein